MASCMNCGKEGEATRIFCPTCAAERLTDLVADTIFETVKEVSEEYQNTVDILDKAEAYIRYRTLYRLLLNIGLEAEYVMWRENTAEEEDV